MVELSQKLHMSRPAPIQGHTQMDIIKLDSKFMVAFPDGATVGEVNAQLEKALCGIAEQGYELEFEVFAPVSAILETIGKSSKGKDAIVRVQVNLYGPRKAAKEIGRELSQQKVYLQTPGYVRHGAAYDNPHILRLPGFDTASSTVFTVLPAPEEAVLENAPPKALQDTLDNVYASLTRGQNLRELEDDERLKTRLLA